MAKKKKKRQYKKRKRPSSILGKTVRLTAGTIGVGVAHGVAATVPGTAGIVARGAVGLSSVGLLKEAAKGLE